MKKIWRWIKAAFAEVLIFPIRLYQRFISPLFPPHCRFTPTCSAYAVTALKRYGAIRGTLLTVCRLVRCQPFCKAGYDPVPLSFSLRPFAGARQEEEQQRRDTAAESSRPAGMEDNQNV